MRAEIHLHSAKPEVWNGSSCVGIWFNDKNVEVTAFIDTPEVAIEAGKKLYEAGMRWKKIEDAKKAPIDSIEVNNVALAGSNSVDADGNPIEEPISR